MIEIQGGVVWQSMPAIAQNEILAAGQPSWYVHGVERVEIEGTGGLRHTERTVYLQEGGSWAQTAYYFATAEGARQMLHEFLGTSANPDANSISDFELAMTRAWEKKKRKG